MRVIRLFAMQRQQLGWRERAVRAARGFDRRRMRGRRWSATYPEPGAGRRQHPVRPQRGLRRTSDEPLVDGDELALIPPVAGGSPSGRTGASSCGRRPSPMTCWRELRRAVATTADGAVVVFVGQTRETPGTPAAGPGGCRGGLVGQAGRGARVRGVRADGARRPGRHRGRDRGTLRGRAGWPSCIAPGTCPWARRACSSRSRRSTGARRSTPAATPSRSSRRARPSGSRNATGWLGLDRGARAPRRPGRDAQRRGGRMRVYLSVDMEGLAGISHTAPTQQGRRRLSRRRAGSWTARRTRPSRVRSTAARPRSWSTTATADVQPDARGARPARPAGPGPQGVSAWSRRQRTARSTSRCSWATTRGPAIPGAPSRTPTPGSPTLDHARRATHRGVRHQRPVPGRPGRARRAGHGRRRARRGGRRLAAVGGAGGGQAWPGLPCGGLGPSVGGPGPDRRRLRDVPSSGHRRASSEPLTHVRRPSTSASSSDMPDRPTSRRSSRASAGPGTGACATAPRMASTPTARSCRPCRLADIADE